MRIWFLFIFVFFQCYCLEFKPLNVTLCKALSYFSFALVWLYTILSTKKVRLKKHDIKTRKIFHILTIGIFLSMLPAVIIEGQSLATSFMTTIGFIFSMMTYGLVRRLNVGTKGVEQVLIIYGFIYVLIVLVNLATFPNMLFGSGELDMDRGGIRMRSNMIMFGALLFFYFLNKYIVYKKKKDLFFAGIMFFAVSASLFRVYIVLMLGLGTLMVLSYVSIRKKIVVTLLMSIVFLIIIPQTTIYKNLAEVSEAQKEMSDNNKEDVRIQGYRYFVYESQTGLESILFGHGIASLGNSEYGRREENRQEETGIYQADVGWAGCFYDFGLITVLSFAYLLIYGILKKKPDSTRYLTYFYSFFFLGAIANGHFQYTMVLILLPLSFYILNFKPLETNNLRLKK